MPAFQVVHHCRTTTHTTTLSIALTIDYTVAKLDYNTAIIQ